MAPPAPADVRGAPTWTPTARGITTVLVGGVGVLLVAHAAVLVARRHESDLRGQAVLFDLNLEQNIPTWSSAAVLALAGIVMAVVGGLPEERAHRRRWRVLGALAVVMSIDEVASVHEQTITPLRDALGTDGALYFAWVIPGIVLVAVVAVGNLRFLSRLPRATALGLALSAACYVGGAVGLEMVGAVEGQQEHMAGFQGLRYELLVTLEEGMEMAGTIGAVHTLLRHVERRRGALRISLG